MVHLLQKYKRKLPHLRYNQRLLELDRALILPISLKPRPPIRLNCKLHIIHLKRLDKQQRKAGQRRHQILPLLLVPRLAQLGKRLRPLLHLLLPTSQRRTRDRSTPRRLHMRAHPIKRLHPLRLPIEPLLLQRLVHDPPRRRIRPRIAHLGHDRCPSEDPKLLQGARHPIHDLDDVVGGELCDLGRSDVGRGEDEREGGVGGCGDEGALEVRADARPAGCVDRGELHDWIDRQTLHLEGGDGVLTYALFFL